MSAAGVKFENLKVVLGDSLILDDVSASVPAGSCTAVIGPNGAGKTTLLLCLLGECRFRGSIRFTDTIGRRPRVAYVPQRLSFDRALPMTVVEFMAMGQQRLPFWLGSPAALKNRSLEFLSAVRADELASRKVGALSGGELQRVLLALALQEEPELLVLDEVAAGVDARGESLFCELLESLRRSSGFTQLMVSHDLATVTHHATHVICLKQRLIAEGAPRAVLTRDRLKAIFGIHMGLIAPDAMPEDGKELCSTCCRDKNA